MIYRFLLILGTVFRVGLGAALDVALYRAGCRLGVYRRLLPIRQLFPEGDFFAPAPAGDARPDRPSDPLLREADDLLAGELRFFSCTKKAVNNPPDWFLDPFTGHRVPSGGHWSELDEFAAGDIKRVWEASRLEWVTVFARAWRLSGDPRYLTSLNLWLIDWVKSNPLHAGPNWKCGQEASIRLINLLLGARLLHTQRRPSPTLVDLVAWHCARILPTIRYAVAQNNNHGISEAAALFIGGAWLSATADRDGLRKKGRRWQRAGRRWLENRVDTLVAKDGSFSQYSVNYHRLVLDTLCQVEIWRRDLGAAPFSEQYLARCRAAVDWLAALTDPETGEAPNLGANDGALLYDLSDSCYRDFRPSVQRASLLFRGGRAYGSGAWDAALSWLDLETAGPLLPPDHGSVLHRDGGDLVLRSGASRAVLRFARFRFRPSHADCLHLDLWHQGRNILRDGGSYSYNTEIGWLDYFSGTQSHNTVQFDGRNQMPRLGRFLFGAWLKMDSCSDIEREGGGISWSGSYTDWKKASHRRSVSCRGNVWRIVDEVSGFREKAVLRWRLIPDLWSLAGAVCDSPSATLVVSTAAPLRRLEMVTGWESLYYQQKTELPVLEIETGPGTWTIVTEITLKD
jgi:hypothetical protein